MNYIGYRGPRGPSEALYRDADREALVALRLGLMVMLEESWEPRHHAYNGICYHLGVYLERCGQARKLAYGLVQFAARTWSQRSPHGDVVNPVPRTGDMWYGEGARLRRGLMRHMLGIVDDRLAKTPVQPDLRQRFEVERFQEAAFVSRVPRSHGFKKGDAVRISCPTYAHRVPHGTRGKVVEVVGDYVHVLPDAPCFASTLGSGCWVCLPGDLTLIPPNKWHKPGAHRITSYRSFRRYKAAGAQFQALDPATRPGRIISMDLARARIQVGYPLWAVVE
ncbi:hypothetical protein RCIP0075_00048 [Klebsiella phage RCIP0075]